MVVLTEILEEYSSSLSTYNYDVFLSFRGEDTRYSFTDHLHSALLQASINTFLDDTDIQKGDSLKPELENAIKSSKASIIVLSKNYASSTWCLNELALIMEQRRTSKHIVLPIFYHVKPSDVRKQQKSFGKAMAKHRKKMELESDEEERNKWAHRIKRWEKALTDVADLKGEEAHARRETLLIEGIVKEISSRLHLDIYSKVPHLIGMEYSVRIITSFLKDISFQNTEFLTIWGMAGIGKTHLANYVFQLHCHDFERSCFLEDIERRCTSPNGLLDLQKQLLKHIQVRGQMDIKNLNEGTLKIEESLRKRTLLVLDGINKVEQLDVLIGTKGLHPGSKIIVTSKNESLTEKCKFFDKEVQPKHMKHLLEGLNDEESLQLLSWHAYGQNEPNESDIKKSMKVVKYCQGHPLALKVLGSSLHSEEDTWESILESLGKETNPDITKILKISFDTLLYEKDKELFKYIACFFVGEDRKLTEDILKACGICKSTGIKILISRCLLTIGSPDILMMHQLLQDMGRDMVLQESPKKPWKRSILWHRDECLDVLQSRRGTTIIQGLVLDMRTFENETLKEPRSVDMPKFGFRSFSILNWIHKLLSVIWWLCGWISGMRSSSRKTKGDFETISLSDMRNLRLLRLNYVQLRGSYKNFPQDLRWLCMHGFRLSYIPSDLPMENLVALDLSNSKLQQLWKKPKLLRSLKFLNLSSCHELVRVDHFSGLPELERLTLARCTSLVKVCESIGTYCHKFEVLDLSECSKLKELPKTMWKLTSLKKLLIDGCLNLSDLRSPTISKPFVISLTRSLVMLSLRNNNLCSESFPMDFSSLSMLKELYLDGNPIDSMPDCLRSLSRLEKLSFENCRNLKTVLCAPSTLIYLDIYDCCSLEKVTFHPEKSAPPIITLFDAFTMNEIQGKFKIQVLSEIDEDVLCSLGWRYIEYSKYCQFVTGIFVGRYFDTSKKKVPTQMLYEHGIFSTYLQGQEVPKWFTQMSNEPSFTLQSSPTNGKIRGLNVCIVHTISSMKEVGPSRIKIRNLTTDSSWTYQPITYFIPEDDVFQHGDEVVVVWLSHWMFGENEFEDGDEVSIHFSMKSFHPQGNYPGNCLCYGGEGPDYANVKEYGISLVYDDEDGGGSEKEDPLGYYKSWKHIIRGDLSNSETSSSHYLLTPWSNSIVMCKPDIEYILLNTFN